MLKKMSYFSICVLATGLIYAGSFLPSLGPWMLLPDGTPAHWLGWKVDNKHLFEPINLIFIDTNSATPEEAILRLEGACEEIGFSKYWGHSSGYQGWIDGVLYPQLPREKRTAFADLPACKVNDHMRVFGPAPWKQGYLFIGNISRESFRLFSRVIHPYVSFNDAREVFRLQMKRSGSYTVAGRTALNNWIRNSHITTGDHDGLAVVFYTIHQTP